MNLLTILAAFSCFVGISYQDSTLEIREADEECGQLPQCPAPPVGYKVVFNRDENGCITGYSWEPKCPPPPPCPRPPPGTVFVPINDDNGCIVGCSYESINCPPPIPCAAPLPGCSSYPNIDQNGCWLGCGYTCPVDRSDPFIY